MGVPDGILRIEEKREGNTPLVSGSLLGQVLDIAEVDVACEGDDLQLLELVVGDLLGGAVQQGDRPLVLGERDDLPDGVLVQEDGAQPVDSDGDTSVGRRTVAEGLHEESEVLLDPLVIQSELVEHGPLEIGVVDKEGRVSVGMKNVYDRIRLNCGPEYGFTVQSAPGLGTCVTFRLPVWKEL